ncbi:hypothetical protein TCA2_4530 [Paenibacillus sp. TCA20]|uniref:Uncharacterized protein n=1 Tax=Paenibacillus urinalis TaxID=521520 RepID=A0ABY7XH28_9BACL|nr:MULTISPECIES: hypothetical protein [Paenibacillus]WDI05137.1 hypothetical protein PUW25_25350 [Paenibacillus urinalis]GAK42038.1 hypothetical protein TCA2_4530 [Paenibacillus sp. TCA20]
MATPNYMKRIAFLDGQVLHDFHLNTMQKNISEAIKLKTMYERYDMLLLCSPYKLYFAEPFVDEVYKDPSSTAILDTLTNSIKADSWISVLHELPATTDELYLLANQEVDVANGASVDYYYRVNTSSPWQKMTTDVAVYLSTPTKFVQIRIDCKYTGTVRPAVYDYCLMWK